MKLLGGGKIRLYLVMPAYNEEENIRQVIHSWCIALEKENIDWKIVVADSGSTDSTHHILKKIQMSCQRLEILSDTGTAHGPKLIALYEYAINSGADYIFQTDSDGQTNPEEFHQFWRLGKKYHAVMGVRLVRGDGKIRKWVETILCRMLYLYFGIRVPDANAPFRLMQTDIVKKYIQRMPEHYELPNVMLTTYFLYYHEAVTFRNITFLERQGGRNSVNIRKVIINGYKACFDFYRFRKGMKNV